jgi:hypothetical protein
MSKMNPMKILHIYSLLLLVCAMALLGCGSEAGTSAASGTSEVAQTSEIAGCLERAGASSATSPKDLGFLRTAEEKGSVSKVGLMFDKKTRQIVRKWTAATFENKPAEWSVWFAQPLNTNFSPLELVDAQAENDFVMFVLRPSRRQQAMATACLEIGGTGENVNFHPIHPG